MIFLKISIDILPLIGYILVACAAGFLLRGGQLRSFRKKIIELEYEMVNNHAEILELQKDKAQILRQIKESKSPVIPLHHSKEDNERSDKKIIGQTHQQN